MEGPRRGRRMMSPRKQYTGGGGVFARLLTPLFDRMLDRMDAGFEEGALEVRLPDGTTRILGGRGPGTYAEITIHSYLTLLRTVFGGSVGTFRAWMKGEWESPDPVAMFALFMHNRESMGDTVRASGPSKWWNGRRKKKRRNDKRRARQNILFHYDMGNDFYRLWLDPTMSYSSGIFTDGSVDLESAQRAKVAAIIDRLQVGAEDEVLEIGAGWGFLSGSIAEQTGAQVTAISLSDAQTAWAREHYPDVQYRIQDYRDVSGQFDAIASVEMVEAVGQEYWPEFLDSIARNLKPGGRAALQYIAIADDIFETYAANADFIQTYIFPGGMLLSESRFRALAEARGLRWTDEHDLTADYARTLEIWRQRFDDAVDKGQLPAQFDADFVKLWRYYLMYCEGGFRGKGSRAAQVTLVKEG